MVVLLLRRLDLQLLHFAEVAGVGLRDRGAWGAWLIGPALSARPERSRRLVDWSRGPGAWLGVARGQRLRVERNPHVDVLT
jgi:hypothetical protein